MSNKMKASKHVSVTYFLATTMNIEIHLLSDFQSRTVPRIPLLEDVPLAASRAVLVTPARTEPLPVTPSNP